MDVGDRLREQRKQMQLTLGQVAEYEGLSKTYLSSLERGVNDPNVWQLLARLAKRYRTSTDYLLGLTDDPRAVREVSPEELAAMLDDAPEPAPEIQALLRFAALLDEEGLYTLLIVAEALAGRALGPSPGEIVREMRAREGAPK